MSLETCGGMRDFHIVVSRFRSSFVPTISLLACSLIFPTLLHSETISGTIQDQSGAIIVGAQIEIAGGKLTQPIVLSSDASGRFVSPDLELGTYSVRVTRDGFESVTKTVELKDAVELQLTLTIASRREQTILHFLTTSDTVQEDSANTMWSTYMREAVEYDKFMTDGWREDAKGFLGFVSLVH